MAVFASRKPATGSAHAGRTAAHEAPGLIGMGLRLILWLCVALLASIAIEWLGMALGWWTPPGAAHSQAMLSEEVGYLAGDLRRAAFVTDTGAYARAFADTAYEWLWVYTGLEGLVRWAAQPGEGSGFQELAHAAYRLVADYVAAAATITQLFAVRVAVLTLSLPAFVLAALVGVLDGLVRRDLRRWGGGRESSFLYHHARRFIAPAFVIAWVAYLSLPVSIHPSLAVLPFAVLFGALIAVTTAAFKKYV